MRPAHLFRIGCVAVALALWTVLTGLAGQAPGWGTPAAWNRTYGGTEREAAHPVEQTSDGGYIAAGLTWTGSAGYYDLWIVRTDALGSPLWDLTLGGAAGDEARGIRQTPDGGFVACGVTHSLGPTYHGDAWLVRIDGNGNELWQRHFGGDEHEVAHAVQQTADGGYVMAGAVESFGAGGHDAWLVRTRADGGELWNRTFGGTGDDIAFAGQQTADGGYLLAGETWSFGAGMLDFWMVKTDAEGLEQWSRTYGGAGAEGAHAALQTADGGYVLAGGTWSFGAGGADVWLVRTDADGNELWARTFGGTGDDLGFAVDQTEDGGFIVAGTTTSSGEGAEDLWLVRTDADGNELWNRTFGGPGRDEAYGVRQTRDGGFVATGFTESFGAGGGDLWIVKTDADGNAPAAPSTLSGSAP